MLSDLLARILARRVVRWMLIGLFNLISFTTVVGIPVAVIVDVMLLLAALQGLATVLRGVARVTGHVAAKVFKVAAVCTAVCAVVGVVAVIAIPRPPPSDAARAVSTASAAVPSSAPTQPALTAASLPAPPQPVTAAVSHEIIALIDARDFTRALALIDAGADVAATAGGRTPLTALELDNSPDYFGNPDAYRLMTKLIATSGGVDRRVNDFGAILWHQLLYRLENNPEKFAEVLDILLARGVDINQENFHGQTLADSQMWPYAVQDIMIARGACGHFPNPAKPQQLVCPG